MRKNFTLFVLLLCLKNAKAQYVTIPDPNFAAWLQTTIPSAMIGNQMDTTSLAVTTRTSVICTNFASGGLGISDLTGIQYFDSLKQLDFRFNQVSNIPTLPNTLLALICFSNNLNSLPILPNSLTVLDCGGNQLSNLPALPIGLSVLNCCDNLLTNLPTLPNSLTDLSCCNNQLTNLPLLPNSLWYLECGHNQLINLPTLPNSLNELYCNNNQLTALPVLPNSITDLDCRHNNIHCFNHFNNSILWLWIGYNPFDCLPNYINAMGSDTLIYPLCTPWNSNGCQPSNGIIGNVYLDANANCLKNGSEQNLSNISLKLYNSGILYRQTYSDSNGVFFLPSVLGNFTVVLDTINKPYNTICLYPGIDSLVTLSSNQPVIDSVDFSIVCKSGFDLGIQSIVENGVIFPGQPHTLNINAGDMNHWYNLNCTSGVSGTVSFSINGPVTYIGPSVGSLTPSVTGNVYTYTVADFGTINNTTDFNLEFKTDTTAQAGDGICVNATITPVNGDNNPNNNTFTYCYNVVNSYDPNIKEVYPIDVQLGFNDWLTYTIHFQNTGNAPAYNIRLADTLDNMLDLETFQVINYSHFNNTSVNGNVLNVRFPNIMLPDSTTNPSGSIGYIQYRVKPKATWAAPYKIKNTAYIYFDYNAPIVTNSTYNSILVPTGFNNQSNILATLYPNPTNGTFTIEFTTKEKQSLQVFDISGQVVLSQSIENGKATIDGNHLAAGIYNISIKGSGAFINKKLVVVK